MDTLDLMPIDGIENQEQYNLQLALSDFARFAGLYYDHPIVSGKNIYLSTYDSPDSDLTFVNNYVRTTYTFDPEILTPFKILTEEDTYGNSPSLAVTQINLLLQKRWDIKDLHLEAVREHIVNEETGADYYIGHWVVVVDPDGDVLDYDGRTTHEDLYSTYSRYLYQVSGLDWKLAHENDGLWEYSEDSETIEIVKIYEIDAEAWESQSNIYGRYKGVQ